MDDNKQTEIFHSEPGGDDIEFRCEVCGRPLTNRKSISRGIGPVCYARLSVESSRPGDSGGFKGYGLIDQNLTDRMIFWVAALKPYVSEEDQLMLDAMVDAARANYLMDSVVLHDHVNKALGVYERSNLIRDDIKNGLENLDQTFISGYEQVSVGSDKDS